MRVLLVACYELGHQPLHVAAPAARLRDRGHDIRCLDLSTEAWDPSLADWADRVAISVPMHTAMRIAREAIAAIREHRADVPVCCYGLYAETMPDVADRVLAGETDTALVHWIESDGERGSADRRASTRFLGRDAAQTGSPVPARDLLPPLDHYVHLTFGSELSAPSVPVAYVEASHGCAHRCRHCPVPVVYDGRIRIVAADDVLADIEQQVGAGARHATFGDPDFLNGVHHSLRVVRSMHERWPDLTWDCTTKVEHIIRHEDLWGELAELGCLFVVSAFESTNDEMLERLDKAHTVDDAARAVALLRRHGIEVRPSWLPFTPWTTLTDIQQLLEFVAEHDLIENVDPVQYTIRLLLPPGSLLLGDPSLPPFLDGYDTERCTYAWHSLDPSIDDLQRELATLVEAETAGGATIGQIYDAVRVRCGLPPLAVDGSVEARPRLTESWFCCAEPTSGQLGRFVSQ